MSKEWFYRQSLKAEEKARRAEKLYGEKIKNNKEEIFMENKQAIKKENKQAKKERLLLEDGVLTVSVDAGKGYTKYAYEVEVDMINKEGEIKPKKKWITDIEMSTVVKGEADYDDTTYITTNGVEVAYNFNGRDKVVKNGDVTKDNDEHKALMQRALYKIALKTGVTDFDVVMCISLDQFKLKENVEEMQKNMFVKEFTVKEDDKEVTIKIHNLVIEPESIVATRFAKKTDVPNSNIVLCDIGTLNVGIVPIAKGKLIRESIIAPRNGYDEMIRLFKQYSDSKKCNYKEEMLEIYVDDNQGKGHKLDEVFAEFFKEKYAPIIKKKIEENGFGEFSHLIFLGGTSCKCKALIEENFKEYAGVEVITDIYATVKGAYRKGIKDLKKIKETVTA